MRIEQDIKLDFDDVLIRPKRSTIQSRKEVDIYRDLTFPYYSKVYESIPILISNMETVGTFRMLNAVFNDSIGVCLHKYYTLTDWEKEFPNPDEGMNKKDLSIVSIGLPDILDKTWKDYIRGIKKVSRNINKICIDVANGYMERFSNFIKEVRDTFGDILIIAGNVATPDMTQELILSGADVVKVGVGSGSSCLTRIKTGIGYPQLAAIMECSDAAHGVGGRIVADGGCRTSGDIVKAFAAGADLVMIGGMVAGSTEAEGEIISDLDTNKEYKQFYGMSSEYANKQHKDGLEDYKASEGRELLIPYTGSVRNIIRDIKGGLKSACAYVGARELKDLTKCTTFVRVTNQYNRIFEGYEK